MDHVSEPDGKGQQLEEREEERSKSSRSPRSSQETEETIKFARRRRRCPVIDVAKYKEHESKERDGNKQGQALIAANTCSR